MTQGSPNNAEVEIYHGFKRLANLISLPFIWNGLGHRKRVTNWPEARLMALLIVSTKLLYGLDGVKRTPKSAAEPAAVGLKWKAWDEYLRTGNAERRGLLNENVTPGSEGGGRRGGKELEVDVEEKDVFDMTGEELDRYMDWFEKNWADDSNTPRTLFYFIFIFSPSLELILCVSPPPIYFFSSKA